MYRKGIQQGIARKKINVPNALSPSWDRICCNVYPSVLALEAKPSSMRNMEGESRDINQKKSCGKVGLSF